MQTGKQISELLPTMLWQGFATGGQYLLPLICVLGRPDLGAAPAKRNALFETPSAAGSVDVLQGMSWEEFEMLVGEGSSGAAMACRLNFFAPVANQTSTAAAYFIYRKVVTEFDRKLA